MNWLISDLPKTGVQELNQKHIFVVVSYNLPFLHKTDVDLQILVHEDYSYIWNLVKNSARESNVLQVWVITFVSSLTILSQNRC